jgi:DNA-binding response OmpR family regulator
MGAKRVLVVDDEQDIVAALKFRLEASGYEVIPSYDGEDGLQKARSVSPDLIISDVMLPKIDGYKMCSLLKKDSRYASIPVIMLTARAQENDKQTGVQAGADIYLTKPFESHVLLTHVRQLLKES